MKKKIVSILGVVSLVFGCICLPVQQAKAAAPETTAIDMTLLSDAEESVGETEPETRGTYLQKGVSSIGEVGTGKIKVGGTTIAQKVVSRIGVGVIVERKVNGSWVRYTSWSVEDSNTYSLTTSKTLTVPRGYYYRVLGVHIANTDNSSSNTNAIYVD